MIDNLKGKGVKFGSGQPTNLGGRKKKIYTILKDKGYSKDDIRTVFEEMLFYTVDELKEIIKKSNTPAIVLITAMSVKNAIVKGDYRMAKEIIEQVIGKALQSNELTGKDGSSINFIVAQTNENDFNNDKME